MSSPDRETSSHVSKYTSSVTFYRCFLGLDLESFKAGERETNRSSAAVTPKRISALAASLGSFLKVTHAGGMKSFQERSEATSAAAAG